MDHMDVMGSPEVEESVPTRHPTYYASYTTRAAIPFTPPLTVHLLHLMATKKTNLCISADVQNTSQLLDLAEECGDHICMLKTHADIITDFSEKTITGLSSIAQRKKFLLFEDRKFGDIGNTVQMQYAAGPHKIANWASIVNAHIFPGPAIITALKSAAHSAIASINFQNFTEITGGGAPDYLSEGLASGDPPTSFYDDSNVDADQDLSETETPDSDSDSSSLNAKRRVFGGRKGSVVSISTTISSSAEYISPPPQSPTFNSAIPSPGFSASHTPMARGLLLLAQMSSEDNLLTPQYTQQCLQMARRHKDFVLGFIAQQALNKTHQDNFIVMTPGVSLPPSDEPAPTPSKRNSFDARARVERPRSNRMSTLIPNVLGLGSKSDGLGQQYNTPRHVILDKGSDIIIVGRAILNADDKAWEAERYRKAGWAAYLERTGNQSGKNG